MLLFDLGGVLIDCTQFIKLLEWETWTNRMSDIEEKWRQSETVRSYQRGMIGTKEFFETISSDFDLTVNIARFLREFRLLPKGLYPGADVLLNELSHKYITACFSNTNEMHWNKLRGVNKIDKYFKFCFPSHIIHEIKPDKEAYIYVIKALGVQPDEIAFFDDSDANISAAKSIGMDAFLTKGISELCDNVSKLGIM